MPSASKRSAPGASESAIEVVVGVTGHRPNRLELADRKLLARVDEVMRQIETAHAEASCIRLVTPLAEGADRLAAEAALERGWPIEVKLPFAQAAYEDTFASAGSVSDFRALLGRSESYKVLAGDAGNAPGAYLAVGQAMLDEIAILIAVWDGKPGRGIGGTPDIIAMALDRRIPVIWIHAAVDQPPQLLHDLSGRCSPATAGALRAG